MEIEEIITKMNNIAGKLDGKEHNMILSQENVREVLKYIEGLENRLKATEEVAVGWKEKYEIATKSLDVEYLDNLKK